MNLTFTNKLLFHFSVAKSSSMFNDPALEIQELTALIKIDIDALNLAVSELQALQNFEASDRDLSKDSIVHSTTICDDLKNRLMGTTKQFKDVLTARTEVEAHGLLDLKVPSATYEVSKLSVFYVESEGS